MASENAFTLDVAGWVGPAWAKAPAWKRLATLQFVAERAKYLKLVELARGIGVDGRKLARVKPSSRPDNATGEPLVPHRSESRSATRMRSSVGPARGTVAIWWSHSWGTILGYHADGLVRGAPVRDVIGLTAGDMRKLESAAMVYFRSGVRVMPRPAPVVPARPVIDVPRPTFVRVAHTTSANLTLLGRLGVGTGGAASPGDYTSGYRQKRAR